MSRNRRRAARLALRCAWFALACPVQHADAEAVPESAAFVEQPRAFGHFVGDHVEQRVRLELADGRVEPKALPQPERLGAWVERVSARADTDPAGHTWLVVDYLIGNSAPTPSVARIPGWAIDGTLTLAGKASVVRLSVPPWPIQVAALAPNDSVSLEALRPDRAPPAMATEPLRQRLAASLAALVVVVLAWSGWAIWRNRLANRHGPFAAACRQLRELAPDDPAAWHAVHRAFERTGGCAVSRSSLPALFRSWPGLLPMRPEIEDFFVRSEARFFGVESRPGSFDLPAFCRKLRRLERRRER